MMTATGIRKDARDHLTNKWGKGALITLCFFLIEFAFNLLSSVTKDIPVLSLIVSIGITVISIPLTYGIIISFMKLKRDEEVSAFDFLTLGFSEFSRAWKVAFSMLAKLILPIVLVGISYFVILVASGLLLFSSSSSIISDSAYSISSSISIILLIIGVVGLFASSIYAYVKELSLTLSYNIAYDEPDLTTKQAVEKSQTLMKGNKGNCFVLTLSFIGWAILAALTFGIGMLWLMPYIQVSMVCFYEHIINKDSK